MLKLEKLNGAWFVTDGQQSIWVADEAGEAYRWMSQADIVGDLLRKTHLTTKEQQIVEGWRQRLTM